jgi:DNA-binding transcriptional LysR family regulator
MIDLVQEAFDLAISPFPPPDATLVRRRLGTLSLMVFGAPAYLEKHRGSRHGADESDRGWRAGVLRASPPAAHAR